MDLEYRKLFGLDFDAEKLEVKGLPIYLTARRSFQKLSRGGREFVLVRFSDEEKYGVAALQKQADLLSERFGMPVAFGFKSISRVQRNSLIDWNIPFISDTGQLYLPFLGMALSERFVQPKKIRTEKMMPVTQSLFLYMLYRDKSRPVMKKDAAESCAALI